MALRRFFQSLFRTGSPPETADFLFFGLGNKGSAYARSRHNIGFRTADALVQRLEKVKNGRFAEAEYSTGTLFASRKKVVVVKPLTFMNRSGDVVAKYISICRCYRANVLVIVDDFHLSFGTLRLRREGSDGGHNGLKSVICRIGGENFPRLRIGIGPLPENVPSIDHVLGAFSEEEEKTLGAVVRRAADACVLFTENGVEAAMNKVN